MHTTLFSQNTKKQKLMKMRMVTETLDKKTITRLSITRLRQAHSITNCMASTHLKFLQRTKDIEKIDHH